MLNVTTELAIDTQLTIHSIINHDEGIVHSVEDIQDCHEDGEADQGE